MGFFVLIAVAGPLGDKGYSLFYNNLVLRDSVVYSVVVKVRIQPRLFRWQKTLLYECCVGIIVTMETDPKKCFFCDLVIAKNKIETVVEKALKSITSGSKERNCSKWELLEDKKNITIHETCWKDYTRSSAIQKLKHSASVMDEEAGPSNVPPMLKGKTLLRRKGDCFNFHICCLFCGEEIDKEKE